MSARYTTELRSLMLNQETRRALDKALSTYPLYNPPKRYDLIPTREQLNEKLLNHYKYREIGFETVGRFLDELEITMCEIMPHYNELFKSIEVMAEIEDPFATLDVTEVFEQETTSSNTSSDERESNASSTSTSGNTAHTKSIESDTPQDEISVATDDIEGVSYGSKAEWNKAITEGSDERESQDKSSSSGSSESEGTVRHTLTRKGAQGVTTYAHDMIEFRDSIIDVMEQIVSDERLNELFMMVY